MEIVSTDAAEAPLGRYSQAIIHQGIIYLAMQLGIIPYNPLLSVLLKSR